MPAAFERRARCHAIRKQKVRGTQTIDYPSATTFDAHAGAAQRYERMVLLRYEL